MRSTVKPHPASLINYLALFSNAEIFPHYIWIVVSGYLRPKYKGKDILKCRWQKGTLMSNKAANVKYGM